MPYQGVTHCPLPLSAIPWRIAPPSPSCAASSGCPPSSPESCTVNISTGFVLSGELIHDSKSLKDRAMNFPVENRWSERGAPDLIEKVGSRPNQTSKAMCRMCPKLASSSVAESAPCSTRVYFYTTTSSQEPTRRGILRTPRAIQPLAALHCSVRGLSTAQWLLVVEVLASSGHDKIPAGRERPEDDGCVGCRRTGRWLLRQAA
eukprot:COSAG02_NODE_5385_length_4376_cov_6.445406_2_plen_204_part_00